MKTIFSVVLMWFFASNLLAVSFEVIDDFDVLSKAEVKIEKGRSEDARVVSFAVYAPPKWNLGKEFGEKPFGKSPLSR